MARTIRRIFSALMCICVCAALLSAAPVSASADNEINKVLATAVPVPVALMDVGNISAGTSTQGCYIASYNWYDSGGNVVTDKFNTGTYRVRICIETLEGYVFSPNVSVYLNNSHVDFDIDSSMRSLTLYRDYTPEIWKPTIFKHPGNETVDAGGDASFVVSSDYTSDYVWTISTPDDSETYDVLELRDMFDDLRTEPQGRSKMNIYNVPAELDGWRVRCIFKGPGVSVTSNYALLTVRHEETEETEPAEELPPEEEADEPESAAPAEPESSPEPTPELPQPPAHEHIFGSVWHRDETYHWKECACGEISEKSAHTMTWTTFSAAKRGAAGLERGVCEVCGEMAERELSYDVKGRDALGIMGYVLYGIGILIAVVIVLMIIIGIRDSMKRRRRRKRRKHGRHR